MENLILFAAQELFVKCITLRKDFKLSKALFLTGNTTKKDETFPRKYIYQMLTYTRISTVYKFLLKIFLMELYVNFITRAAEVTLASELL